MLRNFKQGKLIVKINVSTQNKLIQNLAYNLKKTINSLIKKNIQYASIKRIIIRTIYIICKPHPKLIRNVDKYTH